MYLHQYPGSKPQKVDVALPEYGRLKTQLVGGPEQDLSHIYQFELLQSGTREDDENAEKVRADCSPALIL